MRFEDGQLVFDPHLLDPSEIISAPRCFSFMDVSGEEQTLSLPAGTLTSFVCQTPISVQFGDRDEIEIHTADGTSRKLSGLCLDAEASQHIFWRDGAIHHLVVTFSH